MIAVFRIFLPQRKSRLRVKAYGAESRMALSFIFLATAFWTVWAFIGHLRIFRLFFKKIFSCIRHRLMLL
jgi:hypothetical protein